MTMSFKRLFTFAALASLVGCGNCDVEDVNAVFPAIASSVTDVDFGEVYVGDFASRTLTLENTGSAPLLLERIDVDNEAAFAAPLNVPLRLEVGESVDLPVQFFPILPDVASATVSIESNAQRPAPLEIALSGNGLVAPDCDDDNPCTVDQFDFITGTCIHEDSPLNSPCEDGSRCTFDSVCVLGVCRGSAVDCPAASDQCLRAFCDPSVGCVEVPIETACDDEDPCTLDTCEVGVGCSNTQLADGTPCGLGGGCDNLPLCISGVCTDFPVPEGSFCFDDDVCTVEDVCTAGECVGTRVDADMELIGRARSFGSTGAFTAVVDNGVYVFADPFPDGWRLTTVNPAAAVGNGRVTQWDDPIEVLHGLAAVGNRVLLLRQGGNGGVVVGSLLVAADGGIIDEDEVTVPLSRFESPFLGDSSLGFRAAGEGNLAVVCSGNHRDVGVVALDPAGPSVIEVVPLAAADVCGDVSVSDSVVVLAELVVRAGSDAPGFLSRWTLGPTGLALGTAVSTLTIPGCGDFAPRPRSVALVADQLLYSCARPATGNDDGRGLFSVAALTSDFADAITFVEFSEGGVFELSSTAGGIYARVGGEQIRRVCFVSVPEGERVCTPPKREYASLTYPRSHGRLGGGVNGFAHRTGLGCYADEIDGTPGFGALGPVVTVGNRVYSASQNAAHRIQIAANGTATFVSSGLEKTSELHGPNAIFAVGGGAVGPYLYPYYSDRRDSFSLRSAQRILDVTQPNAPSTTFGFTHDIGRATFQTAVGGSRFIVGRLSLVGLGLRTVIYQSTGPDALTPTELWDEILDDGTSVAQLRVQHAVHGETVTALYSLASEQSAVAVITAPTPNSAEVVRVAVTLEHQRPVSAAAFGSDLVLIRGRTSAFEEEQQSFNEGRVQWFDVQNSLLVPVGEVPVRDGSHVLRMEAGSAFIATSTSVVVVERKPDGIEITQTIELGEVPLGLTLFEDKRVVTTDRQVLVYSPPCPGP